MATISLCCPLGRPPSLAWALLKVFSVDYRVSVWWEVLEKGLCLSPSLRVPSESPASLFCAHRLQSCTTRGHLAKDTLVPCLSPGDGAWAAAGRAALRGMSLRLCPGEQESPRVASLGDLQGLLPTMAPGGELFSLAPVPGLSPAPQGSELHPAPVFSMGNLCPGVCLAVVTFRDRCMEGEGCWVLPLVWHQLGTWRSSSLLFNFHPRVSLHFIGR